MNEHVKPNLLLKCNTLGYPALVELLIFSLCYLALAECRAVCLDLLCLRERADSRCREERQLKALLLYLLALFKGGQPYKVLISKACYLFSYLSVALYPLAAVKRCVAGELFCFFILF